MNYRNTNSIAYLYPLFLTLMSIALGFLADPATAAVGDNFCDSRSTPNAAGECACDITQKGQRFCAGDGLVIQCLPEGWKIVEECGAGTLCGVDPFGPITRPDGGRSPSCLAASKRRLFK